MPTNLYTHVRDEAMHAHGQINSSKALVSGRAGDLGPTTLALFMLSAAKEHANRSYYFSSAVQHSPPNLDNLQLHF